MSQQNNNNKSFAATLAAYAANAAIEAETAAAALALEKQKSIKNEFQLVHIDEDDLELLGVEPKRIAREKKIVGPLILVRDSDLYILSDGPNKTIKSWITDKEVPNRRINERTGYSEKIDPTIEEEDRRLLVPNAILAEEYYSKGTK
jgi:hypothetical protein